MSGYEYWQQKLAGGDPDPPEDRTEMHLGFWRMRDGKPLAVWLEGDKRQALIGFKNAPRMMRPMEMSRLAEMGAVHHAVPEAAYREAFEAGYWHDEPAPVEIIPGIGHNLPDDTDPFTALSLELEDEVETTREFLAAPIESQSQADKAATWSRRIGMLANRLDAAHDAEKAPHLEAGRVVDEKWRGLRDDARELVTRLKRHVEPWLRRLKREAEEKARLAAEEAERKRLEARKAETLHEKAELIREAQNLDRQAEPQQVRAGRPNMRVSLRTERRAKIVDYHATFMALEQHPDMQALVQQLAQRAVKAGVAIAGVEVEEVEVAR